MPNGWYPVPGLDLLLLSRTEQRSPRFEWYASWDRLWAISLSGARGYTPLDPVRVPPKAAFPDVVRAAQAVLEPKVHYGSALLVDFKERRAAACGRFVIYGFGKDGAKTLHDHGLIGRTQAEHGPLTPEQLESMKHLRKVRTSMITHEGLDILRVAPASQNKEADEAARRDASRCELSFEGYEQLVISSTPLHFDPRWPPKSILDVPAVALAQEERMDVLLALWKAPKERADKK